MNRGCPSIFLTVSLVLAVPSAHAQWREQVSGQILDVGGRLADGGYRLADDSKNGSLANGASTSVILTLVPGREYVIVGACDNDCDDLDLRLYDADDREIAEDIELDATPRVTLPPNPGSSYRVQVMMVGCSSEPCFWGLGVFERGSLVSSNTGQGSAQDTRRFAGELAAGDETLQGREYVDRYGFSVRAGQRLVVDLRSSQFDTYLILRPPSGELTANDDFEGSTQRSRVDVVAGESGDWALLVTSYAESETGSYEVTVSVGAMQAAGDSGPRFESGRLEGGDETLSSGEYADVYRFDGRAGDRVMIDLRSNDFDPYLIVRTPSGDQFDNDDYEGDASRSLLSLTPDEDGELAITVTSYREGESGSYDLQIAGVEDALPSARQERGELSSDDETLRSGEFVDQYEFSGTPGQHVRIDLQSEQFDTYLTLQDPRGEPPENDDTDRAGHSVIDMDVTELGTYRVLVTSYEADETGDYELQIDVADVAPPAADSGRDVVTLALGQTMTGRLDPGDGQLEDGGYRDVYVFDGEAGQLITVDMNSSAFDTYVGVVSPSGEAIENDDCEGSTSRSLLELTLRETGRYRVVATSYEEGLTGAYQITLRGIGPTAAGRDDSPLGTSGRGSVYGVFAGISDYGDPDRNLPYTAEDAVRVREAVRIGGGMRPEDGILLTDAQATVAGVSDAIRQLASRMGPDDTFVFFYSGHGGRVPRSGQQAADPDGLDETIVLYDERIIDDDFSQLLSQVSAGKIVLLLDSCFSGGFAKDVISVPGRMGMFSSEEDVTSSVAAKFRAGGFLAVFIADAIADGLADGDGAVSAIELSQYVHERYRSDLKGGGAGDFVRTGGPQLGYQHLVVDRGSIRPYGVLFPPR